jgi:hypothetical protein
MAMNTSSWRRKRENRGGKSDLERNRERLGLEIYLIRSPIGALAGTVGQGGDDEPATV